MRRLIFIFVLLLSSQAFGQAACTTATCTANSCSTADVLAAMPSAGNANATVVVNIPACASQSWTTGLSYTIPAGVTTLSILGLSTVATTNGDGNPATFTDTTKLVDNYNNGGSSVPLIQITTGASSTHFRLSGISIFGGSGSSSSPKYGIITINGNSQNTRVDHIHIDNSTYSPAESGAMVTFTGWVYGVTDHSLFNLGGGVGSPNGVWTWADAYGGESAGFGDNAWAAATSLGTANFMFIENDTFLNGGSINDCTHGGRFVLRYSTFGQSSTQGGGAQTHPTGGSGRARGCRAWEVYHNTLVGSNASPQFNGYFLSNGTGVFWSNTSAQGYEYLISGHSVRRDNSDYTQTATPNGWGYCGTSFNGTGSNWDQNSSASTGYRCMDQPGQGIGDQLSGQFPNAQNNTTGTIHWPNQALEPVYEWLDTYTPAPGYCTPTSANANCVFNNYETDALIRNSDYYLWCNASSPTDCKSFDGTVGVGSGTHAGRSATCTIGVAYWETDTTTLFKCTSTNTWTSYYQPYTYPHPLAAGGVLTYNPGSLSFPITDLNVTSSGQTVTITNTGAGTITMTSEALQTGTNYAISGNTCGGTLGASASCVVTITFTPTAANSLTDNLVVTSSDTGSPVSVPLSGIGLAKSIISPVTGSYAGIQTVTLTNATNGVTSYYTLDGTTPTNGSTLYSGSFSVGTTTTVKSIAYLSGVASAVDTSVLTITGGNNNITSTMTNVKINGPVTIQ